MNITILRDTLTPIETLGKLSVDGQSVTFICDTIERPDDHDNPGVSCVPVGTYQLVPHVSGHLHEDDGVTPLKTWALVAPDLGVTHAPQDPLPGNCRYPHRSECLIHPANFARELEGCIAPGNGRSKTGGMWMVTNSRSVFKALRQILGEGTTGHTLTIEESA